MRHCILAQAVVFREMPLIATLHDCMTDKIDFHKTKANKKLYLKTSLVDSIVSDFLSIFVFLISWLFPSYGLVSWFSSDGSDLTIWLSMFTIFFLVLAIYFYFPPRRMRSSELTDKSVFRSEMSGYLATHGWRVHNNNQNYIFATLKGDNRNISYYYAVFIDNRVYFSVSLPLPAPIPIQSFAEFYLTRVSCNKALKCAPAL